MDRNLLLVSTDLSVVREIEAIAHFLEYELIHINGTKELHQTDQLDDSVLALLHLPSTRDMQEAIAHLL